MLRSNSKQSGGIRGVSPEEEKEGCGGKDLQLIIAEPSSIPHTSILSSFEVSYKTHQHAYINPLLLFWCF